MTDVVKEPSMEYGATYTYADYLTWTVQDRFEILKGRLFKMSPAPSRYHQESSGELHYIMMDFFRGKSCKVYSAPFDVRLPRKGSTKDEDIITVFQPDLCVVCDMGKLDSRGCIGAPDLVVEILSPGNSKKEMREKFEIYEEAGIKEYWMVNYQEKTILTYVLKNGKYIGLKPLTEGETMKSTLFPELQFEVAQIFES